MTIKKKNKRLNLTVPEELEKDINKYLKNFKYVNSGEFIREAIREKLYGENIKEQISNKFLEQIEKEKEYIFEENKEVHNRLKEISKKF